MERWIRSGRGWRLGDDNPGTGQYLEPPHHRTRVDSSRAAWTNFDKSATRQHIRAALDAGATPTQIFLILKMAALTAISACTFAAAGLVEQAVCSGTQHGNTRQNRRLHATACAKWVIGTTRWDRMLALDPKWMEQFGATLLNIYESGVLPPVTLELISVALTAPYTHACSAGTRSHECGVAIGRQRSRDFRSPETVCRARHAIV